MAGKLDIYRDWLGIQEPARPLDYYQLLRLDRFEDDIERIRRHYRKMNAHTRKYATGKFSALSQQLLNELARAMLCLTDATRKAEYDASLGREAPAGGQRHGFEELLLARQVVGREQLDKARQYAEATGLGVRDSLLQQKLAPPEAILQAYAESLGLPFLDLADVVIDPELLRRVSAVTARTHSFAPVLSDGGELLVASPNPLNLDVEEDVRLRFGMPVRMVLCTPADINRVINEHYSRGTASDELQSRNTESSASSAAEPTGLGKVWARVKKWVAEHNKKK